MSILFKNCEQTARYHELRIMGLATITDLEQLTYIEQLLAYNVCHDNTVPYFSFFPFFQGYSFSNAGAYQTKPNVTAP